MARGAFEMKIIYTTQSSTSSLGERVSFPDLLQLSDVISIHTPLTQETQKLFTKKEFNMMKKTATLINTSRGDVIDQNDLIEALQNNTIFGTGLDVTSPEPLPPESPLRNLENIFILPHIGSATYEARRAMSLLCAQNIIDLFAGKKPQTLLNPEVLC